MKRVKQQQKKTAAVRMLVSIEPRYRAVLDAVRTTEGASLKFQIEKAITLWAAQKGITLEPVQR